MFRDLFAVLVAGCLAACTAAGALSEPRMQPIKLTFNLKSGERVANVLVRILDANGDESLRTTTGSHALDVVLPAGTYRVIAQAGQLIATKTIVVDEHSVQEMLLLDGDTTPIT